MSSCVPPPADAPVLRLILVGTGESLLRMEKRLSCAASGATVCLYLDILKNAETLGLSQTELPIVLHEGKVIFSGLPRTEEIESWMKENR
jgi:hypothetical protein